MAWDDAPFQEVSYCVVHPLHVRFFCGRAVHDLLCCATIKRKLALQQSVQDYSYAPDVNLVVVHARANLRGHVWNASRLPCNGLPPSDTLTEAEIDEPQDIIHRLA